MSDAEFFIVSWLVILFALGLGFFLGLDAVATGAIHITVNR